jgi:aryl-alcohol dehydrogenase-like predicted oxidoreductase
VRICLIAEEALARLRTNSIDRFYRHRVDSTSPIGVISETVKKLISDGMVKHFGMSRLKCSQFVARMLCSRCGPTERLFTLAA